MGPMDGFSLMFLIVLVFILGIVVFLVGAVVRAVVKRTKETARINDAPEVTAVASVVDKRIETTGGGESVVRQRHFVSFEQPGGERFELELPAAEFGLLVAGDRGSVTMKGTQYLAFAREVMR